MRILIKSNKLLALLAVISLPFFSQPATASSHASTLKNLGMSEIMFAQGMIPHHQQAIEMSTMALKNGASAEVKKLAKGIISAQGKEISQLKYWLIATKSSMSMGHDMGMSGSSLYKSTKIGRTWTELSSFKGAPGILSASDQLMLVTVGSDIYTSKNKGKEFRIFG